MKTYGLTHVALAVRDVKRSLEFYQQVLGVVPVCEEEDSIQAQTPGTRDVLVFERDPERAGKSGGVAHFGFRLVKPIAVSTITRKVQRAGGKVIDKGEFRPVYHLFSSPIQMVTKPRSGSSRRLLTTHRLDHFQVKSTFEYQTGAVEIRPARSTIEHKPSREGLNSH